MKIKVTNWKARALAAEAERDAALTEQTLAEAENASIRASLDAAIDRCRVLFEQVAFEQRRVGQIEVERDFHLAQVAKVRQWIDTRSETVRRSARVALAEHLGWSLPPRAGKRIEPAEDLAEVLADGIIR